MTTGILAAWGSASARFRELRRDKLLEPGTPKRREARRRLVPDNLVKELEQLLIDCSDQLNILQTVVSRGHSHAALAACRCSGIRDWGSGIRQCFSNPYSPIPTP